MKTILKCALITLALLLAALPACAEKPSISVTGSATIYLEADLAELNIGVRIKSEDLGAAQTESAEKIASIRAALEAANVQAKDIATAEFSIYSYTDMDRNGAEKQYYQVNHMLNITVRDIASVGKLIDLTVQAGANAVNSISFTSSKAQEAYKQAMQQAVQDGREKAQVLCEAAGVSLGNIQNINFSSNEYGAVMNSRSFKMASGVTEDAAASTEIQSGSVSVSASVTLVFEMDD